MFAQINHIAMISQQNTLLQRYYQSLFGLQASENTRGKFVFGGAAGDGTVGFNFLPHRDGYVGGLDHFGMVVDSIEAVEDRMKSAHPNASIVKRPSERPFAAYSGNDPDGNVFDLAQKNSNNLDGVHRDHADQDYSRQQSRYANRYAMRTPNPDEVAQFYADVFELQPANRKEGDENHHLTDGRMTLTIMPWRIEKFLGMSIKRPGPDHIGFKVEDLDAFKADVQELAEWNTFFASRPLGGSKEAEVRKKLFTDNALGGYQIADPDGNWIDITDE
jgi:catechol 2,3-dioxygenase-like lactoylglutathione lyase family enzyme